MPEKPFGLRGIVYISSSSYPETSHYVQNEKLSSVVAKGMY